MRRGDRRGFPLARRVLYPVDDRLHGSRSQPAKPPPVLSAPWLQETSMFVKPNFSRL